MLELCAGSAGFSAEAAHVGFDVLALDCARNRHKTKHAVLVLDLVEPASWQLLAKFLSSGRLFCVLIAPPCGTASKAREKRLPKSLRNKIFEPQPLRSDQHPEGLPSLSGKDKLRVEQANAIYDQAAAFLKACHEKGVFFICENPRNSYLWKMPGFKRLLALEGVEVYSFQHCMWGGKRDKWTSLAANFADLKILVRTCDGSHVHEPWGVVQGQQGYSFATQAEAEYPKLLCEKLAEILHSKALAEGAVPNTGPSHSSSKLVIARQAQAVGKQARGRVLPPLISEFKEIITKDVPTEVLERLDERAVVPHAALASCCLEGPSKLLEKRLSLKGEGDGALESSQGFSVCLEPLTSFLMRLCFYLTLLSPRDI